MEGSQSTHSRIIIQTRLVLSPRDVSQASPRLPRSTDHVCRVSGPLSTLVSSFVSEFIHFPLKSSFLRFSSSLGIASLFLCFSKFHILQNLVKYCLHKNTLNLGPENNAVAPDSLHCSFCNGFQHCRFVLLSSLGNQTLL